MRRRVGDAACALSSTLGLQSAHSPAVGDGLPFAAVTLRGPNKNSPPGATLGSGFLVTAHGWPHDSYVASSAYSGLTDPAGDDATGRLRFRCDRRLFPTSRAAQGARL